MEQLNRVELIGIVGKSINKQVFSGETIIRFTMATSFIYMGKDANPIIETTWHNITYLGDIELTKGDKVHIIGRLRNQKYTDIDGMEHINNDIFANSVEKIEDDIVS